MLVQEWYKGIQRIYVDTSVLGGYFDKEFKSETRRLFNEVKSGEYRIVISSVTEGELLNAPELVKTILNDLAIDYEAIALTDEQITGLTEEEIKNYNNN